MARVRNLKDFKKLKQKNALKEFQHEGSVPTKINNAVSVDEVALTGATAKVKEFEHEGSVAVVTKSQDDGDEQKIFKRQLIENPLHKFAKVNANGGRDHWPKVAMAMMAGGGMNTGQVIGSTDRYASEAIERPVSYQDVIATLYHNIGIDPSSTTVKDSTGRPQYLLKNGLPIEELIS